METQAPAPAPAQAPTPVHPIHQETQTLEALTKWVSENPDNDPHEGTDLEAPKPPKPDAPQEQAQPQTEGEQIELDEETPFFELEYKSENGVEKKTLSAKELREGYLAKQDYHRNIQKVKQQEAQLAEQAKQAALTAQQEYVQRLEQHKQLVLRTVAPELQNVDLNKLSLEDPAEAQRIFFKQIQLNQTLQAIDHEQRQAMHKLQQEQQAAKARAVEKARQTLQSDIQGWNEELYGKILGSMVSDYGLSKEGVSQVAEAELIKVFHDAYQYRQLQKAKPEVSKKVVAVPKVIRPGSAEKPNPASEATQELTNKFKKSGDWRDAAQLYLARSKKR